MLEFVFEYCPPPLIRAERFTQRDLEMAANDIILAMDGKISRQNALFCARAAFESKGMELARAALSPDGDDNE